MKIALILGLYLAIIVHAESGGFKNKWKRFKMQHRRKFNTKTEETRRLSLFEQNQKKLEIHNQKYKNGEISFRVTENRFTDMNITRVRNLMNGFKLTRIHNKTMPESFSGFSLSLSEEEPLPESVDWRKRNAVTPPKDQGRCASCWSFSAVGAIEGQIAIQNGKLTPLSAQYLIDCSNGYGNVGCKGGQPDNAFEFMMNNGGIIPEKYYPYTGSEGQCPITNTSIVTTIFDYWQIPTGDEKALMKVVALNGPVASAIDASRWSMHHYGGGIYDDEGCSNTTLDHSVLIVGYGTEYGTDYWIVRNSWGEAWGESGYIRMIRNKNNQCGIATMASYPLL